ncbi:MAG: hypothetical protein U9R16_03335 [Campylobacterota bacterium]|nr:hypothetical protein [Campylobacterota bacterium]
MIGRNILVGVIGFSLLFGTTLFAKNDGNGNKKENKYKHLKGKKLPKGLEKKLNRGGVLPPGWRDKLIVGTKVDSRVIKRARVVRTSDYAQPNYKTPGTEVYKINDKIIKVLTATNVILDVLDLNR